MTTETVDLGGSIATSVTAREDGGVLVSANDPAGGVILRDGCTPLERDRFVVGARLTHVVATRYGQAVVAGNDVAAGAVVAQVRTTSGGRALELHATPDQTAFVDGFVTFDWLTEGALQPRLDKVFGPGPAGPGVVSPHGSVTIPFGDVLTGACEPPPGDVPWAAPGDWFIHVAGAHTGGGWMIAANHSGLDVPFIPGNPTDVTPDECHAHAGCTIAHPATWDVHFYRLPGTGIRPRAGRSTTDLPPDMAFEPCAGWPRNLGSADPFGVELFPTQSLLGCSP